MGVAIGVGAAIGAGIAEAVTAVGTFFAGVGAEVASGLGLAGTTLGGVGTGSLIGTGLKGAVIGGVGGGALNAIQGKPILPGIGLGALTGGAVGGLGPALGGAFGGGVAANTAADALIGAGAGALGGEVIPGAGGPGAGALGGAASGAIAGLSGIGGTPEAVASPTTGGPGTSAIGIAAPTGLPEPTGSAFGAAASDAAGGAAGGAAYGATSPFTTEATPSFGGAPAGGSAYGSGAGGATTGSSLSTFTSPSVIGGAPAGAELAPIDAAGISAQGALVPSGTNELGLGLTSPSGAAGATTDLGQSQLDAAFGPGGLYPPDAATGYAAGGPSIPPYGTDASGVSLAPAGGKADFGAGVTATPGIDSMAGTDTLSKAAGATSGNTFGNLIHDPSFSNLASFADKNSGLLLGAGLLGMNMLKGNEAPAGLHQINATADQLSAQSKELTSYLTSGTLPPGIATAITQANHSAKAAIRSKYAASGMSGSSAEAQDLANVDQTMVSKGAEIAMNLLHQGVSEAGLAAQLYGQIMQESLGQDKGLTDALAALATASARPSIVIGRQSG